MPELDRLALYLESGKIAIFKRYPASRSTAFESFLVAAQTLNPQNTQQVLEFLILESPSINISEIVFNQQGCDLLSKNIASWNQINVDDGLVNPELKANLGPPDLRLKVPIGEIIDDKKRLAFEWNHQQLPKEIDILSSLLQCSFTKDLAWELYNTQDEWTLHKLIAELRFVDSFKNIPYDHKKIEERIKAADTKPLREKLVHLLKTGFFKDRSNWKEGYVSDLTAWQHQEPSKADNKPPRQ